MYEFYASIAVLGMVLLAIALFWIIFERKKAYHYIKSVDEKKEELIGVINEADEMLEELNRFSDYIMDRIEQKNNELQSTLSIIEERIKYLNEKTPEQNKLDAVYERKAVGEIPATGEPLRNKEYVAKDGSPGKTGNMGIEAVLSGYRSDLVIERINSNCNRSSGSNGDVQSGADGERHRYRKIPGDNVIHMKNRYKEVIRLAERGLSDTDIAKKLDMGKGEISLILGINR